MVKMMSSWVGLPGWSFAPCCSMTIKITPYDVLPLTTLCKHVEPNQFKGCCNLNLLSFSRMCWVVTTTVLSRLPHPRDWWLSFSTLMVTVFLWCHLLVLFMWSPSSHGQQLSRDMQNMQQYRKSMHAHPVW